MKCASLPVLALAASFTGFLVPSALRAQSLPTATRAAEISVFGAYAPAELDYGPRTLKGFSAGGDVTIFPRLPVAPSLEIRGNFLSGQDVTEKTALVGLRVQRDIRRYHPYGDVLIGLGEIAYHPSPYPDYNSDRSKVLSYGVGINIDLTHRLAAKFDIQQQTWNLGQNGPLEPNGTDYTLTPRIFQVGVTYTLPFHDRNHKSDFFR